MRTSLLALALIFYWATTSTMDSVRALSRLPSGAEQTGIQRGQMFIAYRDAVAAFQRANPAFVGSVSAAQLASQRTVFPASFLSSAGNNISAVGAAGRLVAVYAQLPPGSLVTAITSSAYDASIGVSNGTSWTSIAPGAAPQTLPNAIPVGNIVSVYQVGK